MKNEKWKSIGMSSFWSLKIAIIQDYIYLFSFPLFFQAVQNQRYIYSIANITHRKIENEKWK